MGIIKNSISLFIRMSVLVAGACRSDIDKTPENKIVLGSVDTIYSNILNEKRQIWVYVPESSNQEEVQKYPVVYLLDGESLYNSFVRMIKQMSEVNEKLILPKFILVGIINTDRVRDLTPTHDIKPSQSASSPMSDNYFKSSGGGENFTKFLEKELIPYVDSVYPTSSYSVLVGHSLGGLMAFNSFINHTKLVNSYLVIDPSIWWDKQKLFGEAKKVLSEKDFEGTSLFLATSNKANLNQDFLEIKKGLYKNYPWPVEFELGNYLEENKSKNLIYNWRYYKFDDHWSVPLIAEYDGLRFLLSRKNVIPSLSEGGDFSSSEGIYNSIAKLAMLKGDTLAAIENYEQALNLNPKNEDAKSIIVQLKKNLKK
jgi:uncharacterized protein